MSQTKEKKKFSVEVTSKLCKACLFCVKSCNQGVFEQGKDLNQQGYEYIVAARPEDCIGCISCVGVCPDFAIAVDELAD